VDVDEEMIDDEAAEEEEEDALADGMLENQRRIDRLVREHLSTSDGLQLLAPNDLSAALDDFVNRDEKAAISKLCQTRLKAVQMSVNADDQENTDDIDRLTSKIYEAVKVQLNKPSKHKPVMDENTAPPPQMSKKRPRASATAVDDDEDATPAATAEDGEPTQPATQKKPPRRRASANPRTPAPPLVGDDFDDEIEDSDAEVIPLSAPMTKSTQPSRATAIASTRRKQNAAKRPVARDDAPSDSDDSFNIDDEVIEASDDDEVVEASPPARGRKRAVVPAATKPAAKKAKPAAKPPARRAKVTRGRAARGDDSGDDVDEIIAPSRRSARATQNTSTQGTQNTWGRSRRSSGA
jgi:double-strand break repair protein MRE11